MMTGVLLGIGSALAARKGRFWRRKSYAASCVVKSFTQSEQAQHLSWPKARSVLQCAVFKRGSPGRTDSVYPYMVSQWKHERKLVFVATPTWQGFFCERCCWHITLDEQVTPLKPFPEVESRFSAARLR